MVNGSSRLSNGTLSHHRRYDRSSVRAGVVHLGLGAFHRSHQAPVFDALLGRGDARWGITGIAMRSSGLVEALRGQDGLYSLWARDENTPAPRVIGALKSLHVAIREPQAVIAALADGDTHLVTMTVTEKGYLDHSVSGPAGLLARGLEQRRLSGLGPLTIMSCDNLSHNGQVARQAVLTAAEHAAVPDAGVRWLAEVAFPSSMIDRITPATTAETIALSSAALGLQDDAAVWTEPFWQWVLEDSFADARPDFASVGVQVVADVAPWEMAKLRLLNGAHSALAYLGLLRGHRYVHDAIADPVLAKAVNQLWDEAVVGLDWGVVDIRTYRTSLLKRFHNTALPHALIQIAADGSQKLSARILSVMAERARQGLASPALASVVAGWAQALGSIDGIADPLLDILLPIARQTDVEIVAKSLIERVMATPVSEQRLVQDIAREIGLLRRSPSSGVGTSNTSC